jgi:hypothetical protein
MSDLMKKLNLKKPVKTVAVNKNNSIEDQLNKVMKEACKKAIKEHPTLSKYLIEDLPKCDVFKQVKDEIEIQSISGDAIAIPTENVKLVNGSKSHILKSAFKVGVIQTYIGGIKKQIVEFVPTKK